MKKLLFMSVLIGALLALSGCGSSGSTKTYETSTQPAIPEIPNTNGDALVVTNTGEGNVGMSYTKIADGSILVDCGEGGCGDVYSGNEMTDDNSDSSSACEGGNCGNTPDDTTTTP